MDWFLSSGYFWVLLVLAVLVSLITTIIYKYATNQEEIKRVKGDIKKLREKMKKHKNDQKKVMEINQEMMSKNFSVMKQSLRAMLYSFLPIILILSWMAANLAYEPISPGENFFVEATLSGDYPGSLDAITLSTIPEIEVVNREGADNKVIWTLNAENEGLYALRFSGANFEESTKVLVTTGFGYESPVQSFSSSLETVTISNKTVRPFGDASLFGWKPGWLGAYIILSIPLSILLRKILGVA